METKGTGKSSYLDRIRIESGAGKLGVFFTDLIRGSRENAVNLINEKNMSFTTLYILKEGIENTYINEHLSPENRCALKIANAVIHGEKHDIRCMSQKNGELTHSVLKWIMESGHGDDGLDDQYDAILDSVSILLIKKHDDRTFLPVMADTIFKRYRRRSYTHDLIWAFFEARDPYSLGFIANHLNSASYEDVKLSCMLLDFIPCINLENGSNYSCFTEWIGENGMFLYYTGESLQQRHNPRYYAVCPEAKYLFKKVNTGSGKILEPLSEDEKNIIEKFKGMGKNEKEMLSNYSYHMHNRDINGWNEWIKNTIEEQIRIAGTQTGGHHDTDSK
jgi:hypothetical protein